MKRITKIRIPKGKYCKLCPFATDICTIFWIGLNEVEVKSLKKYTTLKSSKCPECLKMYPNGAVFELKEKK